MSNYKTDPACAKSDMNRLGPRLHMLLTNIEKLQEYVDECSSKLEPILKQYEPITTDSIDTSDISGFRKAEEPECEIFGIIMKLDSKVGRLSSQITEITNRCML